MNLAQAIGNIQTTLEHERVIRDRVLVGKNRERKLAEIAAALASLDYLRQRLIDAFPNEVPLQRTFPGIEV